MVDIKEFVIKSANELSDYEIVTGEESYIDLGFDNLDIVEHVMEIEDKFGISIQDEEIPKLEKLSDLIALVKSKVSDVDQKILRCIEDTTGLEKLKGTEKLDDLNLDWFDLVEILMALEKMYNISIMEEDEQNLFTIPNIVTLVKSKLHRQY